jgi:CheY-like chemotaxis protein
VFEPFFTTKEVGEGSGLGLSMVYGFAKQSGGHVTIDSIEGQGTTVNICLPAETGVATAEPVKDLVELNLGGGQTVLVVEDDPDVRDVTVATLEVLDYTVLEAADGHAGLAKLKATPGIDVLLSDVIMPGGMNGVQLWTEAQTLGLDIKCVLMSGYNDLPDGTLPDKVTLLSKPFRKEGLAAAIHDALSRRSS